MLPSFLPLLLALLLQAPGPATAPSVELQSASVKLGSGVEPPPGRKVSAPVLAGVLRTQGFLATRDKSRLVLLGPATATRKPTKWRLRLATWVPLDPAEPARIGFTAPWPAAAPAEGCTLRIEIHRGEKRLTASLPVTILELPAKPPSTPREIR